MKTLNHKKQAEHKTQRTGRRTWVLVPKAALIVFSMPTSAAPAKQLFSDRAITSAVKSDLRFEMTVFPNDLDVSARQGIVTLSGSVNDLLAKRRAVKIAESVRGVLGVIDRITVKPESRPDEDIRKHILMALLNDPATGSYQVSVSVNDGIVTLTGTVGSLAESRLAQRVAEGVKGVKDVQTVLVVNYAGTRTDQEIAADIQAVLRWDIWLIGYPIQVGVSDGHVTLAGIVRSAFQKSRASTDAWVNGVQSVDDSGLKVNPTAHDQMHRKRENGTASEIKNAVEASLHADPRVSQYDHTIYVTVENGVAILDGAVGDLKAKSTAGRDARDIVGVAWVDNELSVRPTINLPSDTDTEKGLKAALRWDQRLVGARIEAAVFGHVAYLNGSVDTVEQKAEAKDVAARTKGVVEVLDQLKIETEPSASSNGQPNYNFETFAALPPKSDAQIKKDIEHAFYWSPFVHRDDITVTVRDGVAKLTGTVGTWIGYGEADQDARKSGALDVINRLQVR